MRKSFLVQLEKDSIGSLFLLCNLFGNDVNRDAGGTETRAVGRYLYTMMWIEEELAEKKREQVSDQVVNKEKERLSTRLGGTSGFRSR